jgi:hypothetical protein
MGPVRSQSCTGRGGSGIGRNGELGVPTAFWDLDSVGRRGGEGGCASFWGWVGPVSGLVAGTPPCSTGLRMSRNAAPGVGLAFWDLN